MSMLGALLEWTEKGVVSAYKFINKVWELANNSNSYEADPKTVRGSCDRGFDKIIIDISNNIEKFHFNKSVAKIYEYVNLLSELISPKCAWSFLGIDLFCSKISNARRLEG